MINCEHLDFGSVLTESFLAGMAISGFEWRRISVGFVTAAAKVVAVGFMVVHHVKHFLLLLMRKVATLS